MCRAAAASQRRRSHAQVQCQCSASAVVVVPCLTRTFNSPATRRATCCRCSSFSFCACSGSEFSFKCGGLPSHSSVRSFKLRAKNRYAAAAAAAAAAACLDACETARAPQVTLHFEMGVESASAVERQRGEPAVVHGVGRRCVLPPSLLLSLITCPTFIPHLLTRRCLTALGLQACHRLPAPRYPQVQAGAT